MQNIFAARRGKSVLDKQSSPTKLPALDVISNSAAKKTSIKDRNRSINLSRQDQDVVSNAILQEELHQPIPVSDLKKSAATIDPD